MGSGSQQSNGDDAAKPELQIPALCQLWRTLASSLPRVTVLGDLDVSLTVAAALGLAAVRFAAEYILETAFGWPVDSLTTKDAAASCAAIAHSLQLVPALIACFLSNRYNPSERMRDAPAWWQETVTALLQFCTGYMVYDGCLNILWMKTRMQEGGVSPEDLMFLGHHLATSLYMTSTRLTGAGHQSAMMCMLLGELTNPLHNSFLILESAQDLDCCNGARSRAAFAAVRFAFALAYCLVRVLVAPPVLAHVTYRLWARRGGRRRHIPAALLAVYTLLIWAVLIGSIPWVVDCYAVLREYGFPRVFTGGSGGDEAAAEL